MNNKWVRNIFSAAQIAVGVVAFAGANTET
jgi:hypothetical protein